MMSKENRIVSRGSNVQAKYPFMSFLKYPAPVKACHGV